VEELLASTTSRELAEWMAYEQLEPFGEFRADLRNAMLCQTIILANGGKADIRQFITDFDRPWKEVPKKDLEPQKTLIDRSLAGVQTGLIKFYEGEEAPAITRIGKRGKSTPAKRRLQEILHGKSR
jgi:hypothetical protein